MSIEALNWALNRQEIDSPTARFVLVVLANYANAEGLAYPSRQTISKRTGLSIRAIQNQLNWLTVNGYIVRTSRRKNGQKFDSNVYLIDTSARRAPVKSQVHLTTKPSAPRSLAECTSRQKPSAPRAPNPKEEEPKKKRKIESSEDDGVLHLYSSLTGNKIKKADKELYSKMRVESVICRIGIVQAVLRSPKTIRSFKYCIPVIEEVSANPVKDPESYLKYLLQSVHPELTYEC